MFKVNIYRRTYVNDVKRERAHEREEDRKMIILLNILGSNPLMTMFCPSPQYLTLLMYAAILNSARYGEGHGGRNPIGGDWRRK